MTRLFTRVTVATLIVFAFASFVLAQEPDAVKVEMYQRFVDNRLPHPDIAYQAARDYLQKSPRVCTTGCEPVVVV